jgi:DNA modification methylase
MTCPMPTTDVPYVLHHGDCLEVLRTMADNSVQCCVTSPPYFGLRDYGVDGQIGRESTIDDYVSRLVCVFREIRRVIKDDGTAWLNLGDSYVTAGGDGKPGATAKVGNTKSGKQVSTPKRFGLGDKNLIGVPWRVAFALQSDGWCLRQDIIWHKPNPMPESVRDRCTKSHEYIFLLSKSPRYFFDADAIRENKNDKPVTYKRSSVFAKAANSGGRGRGEELIVTVGRNKRSVWSVCTKPYKGAHFATFPTTLIEPCILAGSRPGDVVLDPFGGSGTTAAVAVQHGRMAHIIDLNPEYLKLARNRIDAALAERGAA